MNAIKLKLLDWTLTTLTGALWPLAQDLVALYERSDLAGPDKRTRVAERLEQEARYLGGAAATALIHLAIEAAVVRLRARS